MQEARQQQARAPALAPAELPTTPEQARAAEERQVEVSGRWLAAHSIYLDNRTMAGRVGFVVLTPLQLDDGRVLLVQRGWWPRDASERTRVAAPPAPSGPVRMRGRIALAPSRHFELAPDAGGPIRQNLSLEAFARETRLSLLPWVAVQQEPATAPGEASDGLLRQWSEPAADVHKHYGYAVQWFALATLVLLWLLWFQILRPWRRSRL